MFRKKILIVDDSPEICKLLEELLLSDEYDVMVCDDGTKSLNYVLEEEPCLVLLDYMMPKIDGITVLKKIKENAPEVKVIIITGAGTEEIAVEAMKAGADDYVTKPFTPKRVLEVCRLYLAKFREQFIKLNDKYEYPLNDEIISRYEYLRAGYTNSQLSINKLKRYFTFSRQDFYILDKKKREFGIIGLFDRPLHELEKQLDEEGELSPKKRLPDYIETDSQEFNRKQFCNLDSFINKNDPVQIRLEIIRDAATSDRPNVSLICKKYNLTREVFYQNYRRFQKHGVLGLLDKKKGRPMLGSKR
ncbi:response regulator [bacterium]|nr:response regulator [bacterium]